jgi:hypothetical protein
MTSSTHVFESTLTVLPASSYAEEIVYSVGFTCPPDGSPISDWPEAKIVDFRLTRDGVKLDCPGWLRDHIIEALNEAGLTTAAIREAFRRRE